MKRLAFILITFVLGISATPVQKTVNALDAKGGALENSVWGILAVNFQGDTLVQLNKGKRMTPASNDIASLSPPVQLMRSFSV